MALEGTVHTPLGAVSKKTAILGGAAVVILAGIVYMRSRKASQAAATANAGANTGIDPATGYAYGSAEDAAALANQASYINPSVPYAPGGGGGLSDTGTLGPGGFTNNAQWAQYAETTLASNGAVSDISALSAAIGKYLTDQPVNGDQQSLINQAIAIAGYPPVSGPSGYPPSINTSGGTTPTGSAPGAVTGLHGGQRAADGVLLYWNATPGATSYNLYAADGTTLDRGLTGTAFWVKNMKHGGVYRYQISASNAVGEGPKSSVVTVSPL